MSRTNDTRKRGYHGRIAPKLCNCDEFKKAQQSCTDNECYGKLIVERDGQWTMGCDLEPIKFCPWCGNKVAI
jgi:hypothetical protein